MAETRKVQVTLSVDIYERVRELAARQDRSMASVVRESIVRYCVEPEDRRRRHGALERLAALEAPVPDDYHTWERDYSELKAARQGTETDDDGPR